MTVLDHRPHSAFAPPLTAPAGERAARASLRAQIARMERRLEPGERIGATGGGPPRLLDLGELERVRDTLAGALARQARAAAGREAGFERSRLRVEAMLADPRGHRFARVSFADLGIPGCGGYAVRPKLGLVGMLAGWWEVKLSSGCP